MVQPSKLTRCKSNHVFLGHVRELTAYGNLDMYIYTTRVYVLSYGVHRALPVVRNPADLSKVG